MDALNDWITSHVAPLGWTGEATVRLLIAALLAGLVGIEREVRGRQAGFRTNLLVGVGSALVMVVSIHFAQVHWTPQPGITVSVDPGRIAYGVMTGIGFLGAGAIVKGNGSVRGLTTAAALWCVAATGLAAGLGMYVVAATGSLVVLGSLWFLDYVERVMPTRHYRVLVIRCAWRANCIPDLIQRLRQAGLGAHELSFKRTNDLKHVDIELSVSYVKRQTYLKLLDDLQGADECDVLSSAAG